MSHKISLAIKRLQKQRERTGLDYEPVLIFPQGRFSTEALRALSENFDYLGAVNSTIYPFSESSGLIPLRDVILPAQNFYYGFPIFQRRSPEDHSGFALDLFLHKHAFMVEHHEFFKEGCAEVEEFARFINRLKPNIQWDSISEILRKTYLRRKLSETEYEVRIFTNIFLLHHSDSTIKSYKIRKRISPQLKVEKITVNNVTIPFEAERSEISANITPNSLGEYQIHLQFADTTPPKKLSI